MTRIRTPLLVAMLLLLAAAALQFRASAPSAAGDDASLAVEREAGPPDASMIDDGQGCLVPARIRAKPGPLERGEDDQWQPTAAGDRLQQDRCGSVWGLWFNSWTVNVHGDPAQAGRIGLPAGGKLGRLSRSGVADFLPAPDATLWVIGNNGAVARYRAGAWQLLPGAYTLSAGDGKATLSLP